MPVLNTVVGAVTKRMPKAISPKGHAIADYVTAAGFLLGAAIFWRRNKHAALSDLICGGAELAVSLLTDYPGGITDAISFPTHLKLDLGLAAMSASMPEFMHFDDDREKWFFMIQSAGITTITELTGDRRLRPIDKESRRAA
jgi:hypothetical protein